MLRSLKASLHSYYKSVQSWKKAEEFITVTGIRKIETPLLDMFLKTFLFAHFKMQIFYLNILALQHWDAVYSIWPPTVTMGRICLLLELRKIIVVSINSILG